jgi:hypothetical protein
VRCGRIPSVRCGHGRKPDCQDDSRKYDFTAGNTLQNGHLERPRDWLGMCQVVPSHARSSRDKTQRVGCAKLRNGTSPPSGHHSTGGQRIVRLETHRVPIDRGRQTRTGVPATEVGTDHKFKFDQVPRANSAAGNAYTSRFDLTGDQGSGGCGVQAVWFEAVKPNRSSKLSSSASSSCTQAVT